MRGREARGRPATGLPSASWSRPEPRSPCRSGLGWCFRAYLVGSSWQVRPFVAGTPGWPVGFGCTETFRVYPVIPGVPGVFGRTWSEVRGRCARLWQVLRGGRVVPGVPGRFGRTGCLRASLGRSSWQVPRGAGAPRCVSAYGARSWRRARPAAGRCRWHGAVRPHSAAAGPRSAARARRSRPAPW